MAESEQTDLTLYDEGAAKQKLSAESSAILAAMINEPDPEKTKDLTYLFNLNQNKKTMARIDKLNDLLDTITVQTIERFAKHPDEVTNQELLQALKVVQDALERGQKQVVGVPDTPLIQINQQTNEIKLPTASGDSQMSKESRDKVKNAVLSILAGIDNTNLVTSESVADAEIIEVEENKDDVGC